MSSALPAPRNSSLVAPRAIGPDEVSAMLARATSAEDPRQLVLAANIRRTEEAARAYDEAATNPNTRRSYESDWRHFHAYCVEHGYTSLPAAPQTVRHYISWMATDLPANPDTTPPTPAKKRLKHATMSRHIVTIGIVHRLFGLDSPTEDPRVRRTWKGIRRTHGQGVEKKDPILVDQLHRMVAPLGDTPAELRDKALLLVTWASALRRSNVSKMSMADLRFDHISLRITVPFSKTNQLGATEIVSVYPGPDPNTDPLRALRRWLDYLASMGITTGPVFRKIDRWGNVSPSAIASKTVASITKAACKRIGLDAKLFGAHSMRRGFVTTAVLAGKDDETIMKTTKHRSRRTLDEYKDDRSLFRDNAGEGLGL